jgi:pSer/pThr/pTyr-binding forkhead associated (FHA) protein
MTITSIDRHGIALETTDSLEPLERPVEQAGSAAEAGASAGPGRYLAVEETGGRRLLPLARPIVHLGRGFGATIQLEDAGVSRRHAILIQRRGGVRILDDRSANGTFVNGRRISEAELRDGDVVVVGRTVLVYVEHDAARPAAALRSSSSPA